MNLPRKETGFALLAMLLAAAGIVARPQSQSAPPSQNGSAASQISVDSSLVNVLATVRDKGGAVVKTLTKDDFVISEDGRPQTITYFALGQDRALTLGLLVDTSRGQSGVLSDERGATRTFLDHSVREDKDQGFLIHFDQQVELLQDLTPSRQKLDSSLDLLNSPQLQRHDDDGGGPNGGDNGGNNGGGNNGGGGPYGRGRRGGGGGFNRPNNQLYDAIYLASNELMRKQPGRKVIVLFTNGIDRGSKESLDDAIEAAQKSDTLIYSVLSSNQDEGGQRPGGFGGGGYGRGGGRERYPQQERVDPKKILGRIAAETGGQMFEASKKLTFDDIYTTIADDLHGEYSLGYPPPATSTASFHPIKVTVKSKDMSVEARTGYYANFNAEPASSSPPPASSSAPNANSSTAH